MKPFNKRKVSKVTLKTHHKSKDIPQEESKKFPTDIAIHKRNKY
ncbi:MAG: hypothetical protein ACM3JI_05005 [Anaerolineae bacterium]